MTLNNLSISNSQIGVLNTGTIHNVDATVSVLNSDVSSDLAQTLIDFANVIASDSNLANEAKNQALELINEIGQQALAPVEHRKPAVTRALLAELGTIISGVVGLVSLFDRYKEALALVLGDWVLH